VNILEANKILNRVRDGVPYPERVINKALFMTGDMDDEQFTAVESGMRGKGMDYPVQEAGQRTWSR
jgi:hypothetical protein